MQSDWHQCTLFDKNMLTLLEQNLGMIILVVLWLVSSGNVIRGEKLRVLKCNAQMQSLMDGMGTAVSTITHLTVDVRSVQNMSATCAMLFHSSKTAVFTTSEPVNIPQVPSSMCAILANAVPDLQHLSLTGMCKEVALCAFGEHCRQLTRLEVEFFTVSRLALHGIDQALPSLSHLILTFSAPIGHYLCRNFRANMDSLLPQLSDCESLKVLELNLVLAPHPGYKDDPSSFVPSTSCVRGNWDRLPLSLDELHSNLSLYQLTSAEFLVARLRILTLIELPDKSVTEVIELFPLLERLHISGRKIVNVVDNHDYGFNTSKEIDCFQERFLRGFLLSCANVSLAGPSKLIKAVLSSLCPLVITTRCTIKFLGRSHVWNALEGFEHVFSNLVHLNIYDTSNSDPATILSTFQGFLTPLSGCVHLMVLEVCMKIRFTQAGFVSLCMSLPSLCQVLCRPCEGISYESVEADLLAQGRQVTIAESVIDDDLEY